MNSLILDTDSIVSRGMADVGRLRYRGLDLVSQDYLGLARHPEVVAGAADNSGAEGNALLEAELSEFLELPHVVLFPNGRAAAHGAIKAMVRPTDHVLIDALSHDHLQNAARATTTNVVPFAHNDIASLRKRLSRLRQRTGGIFVVTESLFSIDSDHPDFTELVDVCQRYSARLLVDAAHDLGILGPGGRGVLAEQALRGAVDVVIGSFANAFACDGSFAATRSEASFCSDPLIPSQAAAVRTALRIIRSEEGETLREGVLERAAYLREALARRGVAVLGRLSPLVLQQIGSEGVARLAQRRCRQHGLTLDRIEFPACRRGEARFRLQVTPRHDKAQLETAAGLIAEAIAWAKRQPQL